MKSNNDIAADKSELLQQWLKRPKNKKVSAGIPSRPADSPVPLSRGQQRLWFLQQLLPGNPFYHYADLYRLRGPLQLTQLILAFEQVAKTHEILRTTFRMTDGQLLQKIHPEPLLEHAAYDFGNLPEDKREAAAVKLARREARKPFDLSTGPLTRLTFIRLSDVDHLMLLTMHHIITDKWSNRILRDELAARYQAITAGISDSTLQPKIQYADYACWQQSQQPDEADLMYWKEKLSGTLPVLDLPVDHPRPSHPTYNGAFCRRKLSDPVSKQLKTISREANTTMFTLMLAAFKVLLHGYSGQSDILVGTPVTNRDKMELEKLIGFFNDTVVLRSDLSAGLTFTGFLEQVRQTKLEAFSHKNTPFEAIVQMLKPERYLHANPLFQVMFLYHQVPATPSLGPGLTMSHEPLDIGVSKFDLTLYVSEKNGQLTTIFEYATDLFEGDTIERMQDHMHTLLEAIADDPDKPIADLPMLTTEERKRILTEWNDTDTPIDIRDGIHRYFEQQAAERPDHPAVVCNDETITCRELDRRANAIAGRLKLKGVGPNTPVGLCTERSPDMLAGILGILKAGAAYLPLDPEYPAERIRFMLEDAAAPVVLMQPHLQELMATIPVEQMLLDDGVADSAPSVQTSGNHLAYVIYTSGSTGQPKGVGVTHDNLIYSTMARSAFYPEPPDRFLLLSSFSFDSSVVGIFWTLCNGGTLVLPEKRIEQDMDQLADLISRTRISHTLLLPSLYELLLCYAEGDKLSSLQTVIVAGEACSPSLVKSHYDQLPGVALYNEYGPTEATVWCIAHRISEADADGRVPIGRPVANTRAYILDGRLQPVPIGVTGELYIGGKGITPGYLNRVALTRERFIDAPFSGRTDAKLYRTGDLARYRADGTIEFLGRADSQVKIRGFRIEPDEIREVLTGLPGVEEGVVVVQTAGNDTPESPSDPESVDGLLKTLGKLDEAEAERLLRTVEQIENKSIHTKTQIDA